MTGIESAIPARTSMVGPSLAGSSTSAGRCRVTRTKSLLLTAFLPEHGRSVHVIEQPEEAVDHRVADQLHAVAGDPLARQVLHRVRGGAEQHIGDAVREDPVHLLGHLPVARAQARLDVGDCDAQLGGGQRRGQGGIDVAGDQHQVGGVLQQVGLDAGERRGRLLGVGARADAEVGIRLAHLEALDESPGERLVVVLARVQEPDRDPLGLIQRGDHRRRLDEVGTRPDDGEY